MNSRDPFYHLRLRSTYLFAVIYNNPYVNHIQQNILREKLIVVVAETTISTAAYI